jgi:hypothetical protein
MLLSWIKLSKYKVQATDGVVGALDGVYFIGNRFSWMIRYFVVNVKDWMNYKQVLIPMDIIGRPFRDLKKLPVEISSEEVKNSHIFRDENLLGTKDIIGFTLSSPDGGVVGYVDDLIVDDGTWEIKYLVVSLWEYAAQKRVLVPPTWIEEIVAKDKDIRLNVLNSQVGKAVPYEQELSMGGENEIWRKDEDENRQTVIVAGVQHGGKPSVSGGRWNTAT